MKRQIAPVYTNSKAPILSGTRSRKMIKAAERAETQLYLRKLLHLVPSKPNKRQLSQLDVIEMAIKYICELQSTLKMCPNVSPSERMLLNPQQRSNNIHQQDETAAITTTSASTTIAVAPSLNSSIRRPLGLSQNVNSTSPSDIIMTSEPFGQHQHQPNFS